MRSSRRRRLARAISVLTTVFLMSQGAGFDPGEAEAAPAAQERQAAFAQGYDRPARTPGASRSPAMATQGMVATSQPLAAQVGLQILRDGGNAIDAAVAVNAMLGLVEPHMNGIGGDLFALVWHAESETMYALNGTGRSPHALNPRVFHERGLDRVPGSGPLSWTVPGAVDGWEQLLERLGTMTLAQVLEPAIGYARNGFPVTEIIAGDWRAAEDALAAWPTSAATYLPDGRAPRAGEIFRNPDLARTYAAIAEGGADAFYRGIIAERIVAFSEANEGYFAPRDFAEHTSTWVNPVHAGYRGHDVWQLPPNSHGITALMMLEILEGYDLAASGHNSVRTLHRMVEAKKLAFADRTRWVADPEFNPLPVAELISEPYAALRRALIRDDAAATSVAPGDVDAVATEDLLEHGDTVYLTVVDAERNAVSFIQSIFSSFGSKVVPGDLGFALQNRATGFSLEQGHVNVLEPAKRSLHTNMPGMVTRDGRPWLSYGVMGGNMQPQGHVQVLANLIDFGMNVQEAGDAARFRHFGGEEGGVVVVESGITDEVVAALEALGHRVRRGDGGSMGGYQAILIDLEGGVLQGGSDPRKDGLAIGY